MARTISAERLQEIAGDKWNALVEKVGPGTDGRYDVGAATHQAGQVGVNPMAIPLIASAAMLEAAEETSAKMAEHGRQFLIGQILQANPKKYSAIIAYHNAKAHLADREKKLLMDRSKRKNWRGAQITEDHDRGKYNLAQAECLKIAGSSEYQDQMALLAQDPLLTAADEEAAAIDRRHAGRKAAKVAERKAWADACVALIPQLEGKKDTFSKAKVVEAKKFRDGKALERDDPKILYQSMMRCIYGNGWKLTSNSPPKPARPPLPRHAPSATDARKLWQHAENVGLHDGMPPEDQAVGDAFAHGSSDRVKSIDAHKVKDLRKWIRKEKYNRAGFLGLLSRRWRSGNQARHDNKIKFVKKLEGMLGAIGLPGRLGDGTDTLHHFVGDTWATDLAELAALRVKIQEAEPKMKDGTTKKTRFSHFADRLTEHLPGFKDALAEAEAKQSQSQPASVPTAARKPPGSDDGWEMVDGPKK